MAWSMCPHACVSTCVCMCRYVHGFKQQRKGAADVESGEDAERRYGRMYEERINPFAEFQVGDS